MRPPLARFPLITSGYANPAKSRALSKPLVALVEKLVVEKVVVRTSLSFYNRLFLVPKPGNKWRPILDLSAQSFSQNKHFQDGNPRNHQGIFTQRGVGHVAGLQRRLLSYSHSPQIQKIPQVLFEQQGISVHSPSFRTGHWPQRWSRR